MFLLLLPPVFETQQPLALLDWHCGAVDERRRYPRDRAEVRDRRDVVVQQEPHRKSVDAIVRFEGPLLEHPREFPNSRRWHISQMHRNRILRTVARREDVGRLSEDAFDFRQSVGRPGRHAQ